MPELVAFSLPCQHDGCNHPVTIRSDHATSYIDDWLDGIVVVFCALHRDKAG